MKWRFKKKKVRVSTIFGLSILKNGSSIYQGKADVWRREGEVGKSVWFGTLLRVSHTVESLKMLNEQLIKKKIAVMGHRELDMLSAASLPINRCLPGGQNGERMTTSTAVMLKGSPRALASSMCHDTGSRWKRMAGKGMNARGKGVRKKNRTKMTGMPWATIMIPE